MTPPTMPGWLPDVLFAVSILVGIAAHLFKH